MTNLLQLADTMREMSGDLEAAAKKAEQLERDLEDMTEVATMWWQRANDYKLQLCKAKEAAETTENAELKAQVANLNGLLLSRGREIEKLRSALDAMSANSDRWRNEYLRLFRLRTSHGVVECYPYDSARAKLRGIDG